MAVVDLTTLGGETIEVGDSRDLRITFRDRNGRLIDPSTVTITILKPDTAEDTYDKTDLTRVRLGVYTLALTFTLADTWHGKIEASGIDSKQFRISVGPDLGG
jgi:hypothetical protein